MENNERNMWPEMPRRVPKAIRIHMGELTLNLTWDNSMVLDYAAEYKYMRHVLADLEHVHDNVHSQLGPSHHLFLPQPLVNNFVKADFPILWRPEPTEQDLIYWAAEMDDRLGKGLKKREQNPDIDKDI